MTAHILPSEKGFLVQGKVAFDNVTSLRRAGEAYITQSTLSVIEIDLSAMKDQDASAISLLLCWMRAGSGKAVRFKAMSESLLRMWTVFGLNQIGLSEVDG